jgi:hypothetical protein
MNIYFPKETDELLISLKEYLKTNPLDKKDYVPDDWITIPSTMKGQTAWNKGKSLSNETKLKISETQKIKLQNGTSKKQRLAAKETLLKTNVARFTCENCGKITNLGNYKRWHGVNCGIKITHSEETRKKISESSKGKFMSEKCRLALLESNKKRKGKKYPNGYKTKNKSSDSF